MMNKLYKSWTEETGLKVPATVSIEVTIRCNMRCPMCDRTHKEDYIKHLNEIPTDVLLKNINSLGKMGVKQILLIGGGEPLCRKDLPIIMECIKQNRIKCHLWTNGTLFDEKNAERIIKNADIITISLDSHIEAEHDKSRGVKGSYAKIMETLNLIKKYRRSNLLLRFHSVISKINIDNLDSMVGFAKEKGVGELGGAIINPWDFAPHEMLFTPNDKLIVEESINRFKEKANKCNIALAGTYNSIFDNNLKQYIDELNIEESSETPTTCFGLWSMSTIRPNGDVSICCFTYKPIIGNLLENDFEQIWNSDRAKAMRQKVKQGMFLDKPCKGCTLGRKALTSIMKSCENSDEILDSLVLKSR